MIFSPRPGQPVRLHYRARVALSMPHHGRTGVVLRAGRGPGPRNVEVLLALGPRLVVPRGNLVAI